MVTYVLQASLCLVGVVLILLFWPYKESSHNIINACWLLLTVVIILLSSYQYFETVIDIGPQAWAFWLQYVLLIMPLFWITWCVLAIEAPRQNTYTKVFNLLKKLCCCVCSKRVTVVSKFILTQKMSILS